MSKFGTANYSSGGFTKRTRYKLKDGDNIFRILPPMGDLAEKGIWSVYYNVVFGFKTSEGKHRPFQSPQVKNRKTKMIDVKCAATEMIYALKDQLEVAKKAGDTAKVAQLAKIVGNFPVMGIFSLNNDHYMNVIDRQGNPGQLELGHKAMLSVKSEIQRLRDADSIDPLSPENGRFLNIRRSGKGLDTQVQVTVLKEKINVPGVGVVERDVVHVIDEALGNRLLEQRKDGSWKYLEAAPLDLLFKTPSSAEVDLIVSTVDILTGKSTGVDEVFAKDVTQTAVEAAETLVNMPDEVIASLPAADKAALLAQIQAAEAAVTPAPAAVAPAAAAVVQEAKAAVAAPAVAVTTLAAATGVKTTAEAVAAMSPDDFMKQMGITLGSNG